MGLTFVGIAPGAMVGQPTHFRSSFTAAFWVERHWPTRLWDNLPASAGVIPTTARPLTIGREVEVIDLRTTARSGNLTADQLAAQLSSVTLGVECVRLERIDPAQAGDATAVEQQAKDDAAAQHQAGPVGQLTAALGSLGRWVVLVLVLVAVIAVGAKLVRR